MIVWPYGLRCVVLFPITPTLNFIHYFLRCLFEPSVAVVRLSCRTLASWRYRGGTYVLDPLKKYYVFCDLSVREKAWRGKPGL